MIKQYENIYMKKFGYFNLYIIKGENGDILIDTGFIGIQTKLKKWLDKFNVKLIILTHAHIDHTWNTAYIQRTYNCEIAISKLDIINLDNRNIKTYPSSKKHKNWTKLMSLGMKKFISPKFDVDVQLNNNQIINKYGIELKILSLPGHTNGSIGILYKDYLFAGDSLVYRKKYPEIAYQNQNTKEAVKSFDKIYNLKPKIIFIGHDKPIPFNKLKKIYPPIDSN